MADTNIALIVMMVISIVLLFVSMVLSSMAASNATNEKSKSYSTYSAIVSGLAVLLIGISLGLYFFRAPIASKIGSLASSVHEE